MSFQTSIFIYGIYPYLQKQAYCGLLNTTVYEIGIPKIYSAAAVVNMH